MRLERFRLKGIGPFREEVALDLSAIEGTIVAVCGGNGQGKTCLLEASLPGVMYRTTPTRGSINSLATGRDSYVEATVVNGSDTWTIRQLTDAVSGKSESLVLDASGAPVLPDAKVRSYDAWAAQHLPSPEVFLSSLFSAQAYGGFLAAKPSERKGILLRALQIESIERVAEKAREHEKETRQSLAVVQALLTAEQSRGADLADAEKNHADAIRAAGEADVNLGIAKAELLRVEEAARQSEQAQSELNAYSDMRSVLNHRRRECTTRITDLEQRIANNQAILTEADTIRQAVVELEALRSELETLRLKHADAVRDYQGWTRDALDWRQRGNDAGSRAASARARIAAMQKRLSDTDAIEHAVARLPKLREAFHAAEQKHKEAQESYEALRAQHVFGAEERCVNLRGGLRQIADKTLDVDYARHHANEVLETDDVAIETAEAMPGLINEASRDVADAFFALERERRALTDCELLASRITDLDLAQQDLTAAFRDEETAKAEQCRANLQARNLLIKAEAERNVKRQLDTYILELEKQDRELEPMVAKAQRLDAAETRLEELTPQLEIAQSDLARIDADIEALGVPPDVPLIPDTESAAVAVRAAELAARNAHMYIGISDHNLQLSMESVARITQLETDRTGIESELADWTKLAKDLGRDGLQAMEVDAVGVELTELANDFLHSCFGSRWTISIETQRNSADGKKLIEGCEVRVLDTEHGRDALAESLSGGERVIISEAISLALLTVACRRTGVERPTIIRDETGAALDPTRGAQYIQMLRRAAETIGAEKVLFVAHNSDLWDLADARIVVADGTVEVSQ